jgi:DNA-binding transcriptional LysR family regulator
MDRDLLPHLAVAIVVGRRGGFAAAAAELGMTASAVSHAVRVVEERIGQPLFARTTRSVALTEAGAALLATAEPALADIGDQLERIRAFKGEASGLLRINTPRLAIPMALTPIVAAMAMKHPAVTVELFADDALVDIVGQGFDAGVRLGEMIAQDMIAVRLTPPFRTIMVASPEYLTRRGTPVDLTALSLHNCIGFRMMKSGAEYQWEVVEAGVEKAIATRGSVIVTDPLQARDLALAHVGIAYMFEPLVRADITEKRLFSILPETGVEEPGLFLYFPKRASMAPKLRAFIDIIRSVGSI